MLIPLLGLLAQALWSGPTSGIITLDGTWRFHAGDDSAYAAPAFNDAAWDTVTVPSDWREARGAPPGYAWYRLRLRITREGEALALRFRSVAAAYEVYVDGERIGGIGAFPPSYRARLAIPAVLPLPAEASRPGAHLIAVRVFSQEHRAGIVGPVDFGPALMLMAQDRNRDFLYLATALLLLGIGLTQVIFWLRRTHALEHLFIFLFTLSLTLYYLVGMHATRLLLEPVVHWSRPHLALAAVSAAAFLYAFRRTFTLDGGDRLVLGLAVYNLLLAPGAFGLPEWRHLDVLSHWLMYPGFLAATATVLVISLRQVRLGVRHARVLVWGTVIVALALLNDLVLGGDPFAAGPASPLVVLLASIAFVGSLALTTAEKFANSESAALYDRLTGLYRREVVMDALQREIRRAARTRQPLSVIMLDVDRFKQVNDTLGHQIGDRVLAEVGRRLGEAGRAVDWLGRYGGEEFIAVLASTARAGAHLAAERLRSAVAALPIATGRTARSVTLSAGVSTFERGRPEQWPTTEELVGAADAALYRAKDAGRNCVSD